MSPGRTTQVALLPVTAPRWTRQISPSGTWPSGTARRRAGEPRPAPGLAQPLGVHGHAAAQRAQLVGVPHPPEAHAAGGRSTWKQVIAPVTAASPNGIAVGSRMWTASPPMRPRSSSRTSRP